MEQQGQTEDLRARVRRRTREEVAQVAFDLFATRGFEATKADQVAEAAGISRASFFRLFSSKEEAVFVALEVTGTSIAAALADRPPREDPWTALRSAFIGATDQFLDEPEQALARARMIHDNPSLRARLIDLQQSWGREIREPLAERMGEPADSLAVEAVVRAALAAFDVAATRWGESGGGDLVALIDGSFEAVAAVFD
jgi:AcrR family transcriptional regulator